VTEPAARLDDQRLVALDRKVDAAEGDGILARWEFGHELLAERVGKQLPAGRLDEVAELIGKSREEVSKRMTFARRFPTETEVRNAVTNFHSWHDVVNQALASTASRDRITANAAGQHRGTELADGDAEGPGWSLLLGDCAERADDLEPGSVAAIVTDPPYPDEYLPLWDDLGRIAARLLAPGGVLVARCGHLRLPDVLAALGAHLAYGWTYAEPLPGSNVRFLGRKIAVAYQPWVAFSRGPWPSGRLDWHPDLLTESPRAKARYVWEQKPTVAAELTATLAPAGSIVLDPFAGSGSYGEAAIGVGCLWVGIELDPAGHAQAAQRLTALRP
jgi:16S rRNA G966 N2-methylase RsmD